MITAIRGICIVGLSLVLGSAVALSCMPLPSLRTKPRTRPRMGSTTKPSSKPLSAAEAWLKQVDEGKFAESWDAAAEYLRGAVGKEAFVKALDGVRKPLGAVTARKIKSKEYRTSLPGARRTVRRPAVRNILPEQEGGYRDRDADARQGRQVARVGLLHQVSTCRQRGGCGFGSPRSVQSGRGSIPTVDGHGVTARCNRSKRRRDEQAHRRRASRVRIAWE